MPPPGLRVELHGAQPADCPGGDRPEQLLHGGCAHERVYAHQAVHDELVDKIVALTAKLRQGDPSAGEPLDITHHGEAVTVAVGETVARSIRRPPERPRPQQPPGREPVARASADGTEGADPRS